VVIFQQIGRRQMFVQFLKKVQRINMRVMDLLVSRIRLGPGHDVKQHPHFITGSFLY